MTSVRTISILTTTTLALLAAPAFAAGNDEHDAHHPAAAAEQRVARRLFQPVTLCLDVLDGEAGLAA